jgi:DHA2 family multidrug resistance protein
MFMARGSDWNTATAQAYGVLNGMIHQQAAMIAFIDVVRLLAIIFILVIPLVLIMRRPQGGASPPPGAH